MLFLDAAPGGSVYFLLSALRDLRYVCTCALRACERFYVCRAMSNESMNESFRHFVPWPLAHMRAWTIMLHELYIERCTCKHPPALRPALSIKCQPQTQAPLAVALRPERLPKEGGRRWGKWPERSLRLRRGARSHQQERG